MDIKSIPEKIRAKMSRAQIWMRQNEAVHLGASGYRRGVHYIGGFACWLYIWAFI